MAVHGRWPGIVARGSWLVARGSWLVARGSWLVARGLSLRRYGLLEILLTSSIGRRNVSLCAASDERGPQAGRISDFGGSPPPRPIKEGAMAQSVLCPPNYKGTMTTVVNVTSSGWIKFARYTPTIDIPAVRGGGGKDSEPMADIMGELTILHVSKVR
jgi:hypothetical protein